MVNNVDHPEHYQNLKVKGKPVEAIDIIDAFSNMEGLTGDQSFALGTAIKYLTRFPYKNKPVEDLEKAKWYLDLLIKNYKGTINEDKKVEYSHVPTINGYISLGVYKVDNSKGGVILLSSSDENRLSRTKAKYINNGVRGILYGVEDARHAYSASLSIDNTYLFLVNNILYDISAKEIEHCLTRD